MIRGLKIVMIIFGAVSVLSGLAHIFIPDQLISEACSAALLAMAMVGVSFVAGGVYLIIAGTRDIIRHIYWVQFAILWAILSVAGGLYSVMRGYVTFEQSMMPIIIDAVFAVALLALYPWRAAKQ